jgi:hypothetical protein
MMRVPILRGVIDRRMLVNFRVRPEALQRVLPPPFRPRLVRGVGMAGVCLIRLKHIRPRFLPAVLGISSENAAHRIAVEWERDGRLHQGVYIPRRDTSSRLNALAGGRLFPGVHHHARFDVQERDGRYRLALRSDDGRTRLSVRARLVPTLPAGSVFRSLREASEFFEVGSLGYSPGIAAGQFDGLELRTFQWRMQPLAIETVESSFFSDAGIFPPGSVEFDCALLMRGVEHEWCQQPALCEPAAMCPT